jgi:GNAT superfamily N-acetyltransferase
MIIDLLDCTNATAIYIYKLDRPAEQWMFDLGFDLQFESFATLIGKLEFGLTIEDKAKIEKLFVIKEYRNQGFATYMMKKAIDWGISGFFSELNLTACTSVQKLENELNQAELVSFYYKLGFRNTFPKSNQMTYKYCTSGAKA